MLRFLQLVVTGEIPDVRTVPARQDAAHPTVVQSPIAIALARSKVGTWSSSIGKFKKPDKDHGLLWKKIRNWWCGVGLCNMNTCTNKKYHQGDIPNDCRDEGCDCHDKK